MAATPPPPMRLRTPPTPRHGPRYDSHEPYSPRRSNRISSRKDNYSFQENMGPSIEQSSTSHYSTGPQKKATFKRTPSQIYSPPSSPIQSPQQMSRSPRNTRHPNSQSQSRPCPPRGSDIDLDMVGLLNPDRHRDIGIHGMPTPAKTPKKRGLYDESQMKPAARVLFPPRPTNTHDYLPPPRKARKNKHAFALLGGEEENTGEVPIYTDSKERIPELDETEDNPFLARRSNGSRRAAQVFQPLARNGTKHGLTKEIDEAVERGEGMVYVFRGKKIFRKFSNEGDSRDNDDDLKTAEDAAVVQSAGPASRQRMLRRNIQPRLLFPPKEAEPEAHEDEEALTDIDPEPPVPSQQRVTTPTGQTFHMNTPPASEKKHPRIPDPEEEDDSRMWLDGAADQDEPSKARKSRNNAFDAWQRTKPGIAKRTLDAVEKGSEAAIGEGTKGKKARSGH